MKHTSDPDPQGSPFGEAELEAIRLGMKNAAERLTRKPAKMWPKGVKSSSEGSGS